jgi:DNA-binding transcriptional ArsR family regulator
VGHGVPDRRDALNHVPDGRADLVFAALADPTRRRLLDELSVVGPRTATELAPGYPMSRQAVVKHLGTLASAGLLAAERDGRDVRYRLVPDPLTDATAWLAEIGHRWDDRLAALGRHLDPGTTASA